MVGATLSVCMVNYNHAQYLAEALQALLDQTSLPTEFIIVDDGSTDNSVEIIERFAKSSSIIRLFRNDANYGALYSINRALKIASCDYIAFQAADDRVLPEYLEECMAQLAQHPRAAVCSGLSRLIDEEGRDKGLFPSPAISINSAYLSPSETLVALRRYGSWFMGNAAVLHRRSLIEAGGFRPELHSFTDGFMHMVLSLKHGACFVPEPLACWRLLQSGYSQTTNANCELALGVRDAAARLMRTTYRDLFPDNFVDTWVRCRSYDVGITARDRMLQERETILSEAFARLWPSRSWHARLFLGLMRLVGRVEALAIKLLLFGSIRDFPDWVNKKLWRLWSSKRFHL